MRELRKVAVVAAMVCSVGLAGVGAAQAHGRSGGSHDGKKEKIVYKTEFNCHVDGDVNSTTPSQGASGAFAAVVETTRSIFGVVGTFQPQGVQSTANICSPGATTTNESDGTETS